MTRIQLHAGPRIVPELIGSEPFSILAFEEWMGRAMCLDVDPELFYPDKGQPGKAAVAKRICGMCPVIDECLAHAVAKREQHGIWGGLTPKERMPSRLGAAS